MPVGDFRLQDPGGAGPEKYANPARPEARRTARDGLDETILPQSEPGEAVVAAFELREARRQWLVLEPGHLTDIGIELNGLKVARDQTSALGLQCIERGGEPGPDAAGGRHPA